MHLSPEQLVDLIEGVRDESTLPHLRSCASCQAELASLQAMMGVVLEADVPEPSPLFWPQMSARVREAVATEDAAVPAGIRAWLRWGRGARPWVLATGALAVVALTFVLPTRPTLAPGLVVSDTADAGPATPAQGLQPFGSADDPSLALVADLTEQMDPDAALEAGVTDHVGGIDEAVGDLSEGERVELQRLLREALAKPGA